MTYSNHLKKSLNLKEVPYSFEKFDRPSEKNSTRKKTEALIKEFKLNFAEAASFRLAAAILCWIDEQENDKG
ncbi:hypothetical protein GC174_12145 [bacterium]|nr:hypothetical protein [bacterium]